MHTIYKKNTMYVSTQQCHTCIHQNTCVTAAHQNSCRLSQGQRGLGKFWGSWYHMPSVTFDSKLRHQPIMWTLGTCPASVTTKRSFFSGREEKKKAARKLVCLPPPSGGGPMMFWISPVTHDIKSKFTPTSSSLIVTLNPSGPQGRKLAWGPFLTGNQGQNKGQHVWWSQGNPLAFSFEMKRRDVHNFGPRTPPRSQSGAL